MLIDRLLYSHLAGRLAACTGCNRTTDIDLLDTHHAFHADGEWSHQVDDGLYCRSCHPGTGRQAGWSPANAATERPLADVAGFLGFAAIGATAARHWVLAYVAGAGTDPSLGGAAFNAGLAFTAALAALTLAAGLFLNRIALARILAGKAAGLAIAIAITGVLIRNEGNLPLSALSIVAALYVMAAWLTNRYEGARR